MVAACVAEFGRVDFAVNNVGIASPAILTTERDVENFDKVHMVNLKGVSQ